MAWLQKRGDPPNQLYELTTVETKIGRAPDNHLVLGPNGVSRYHAVVTQSDGKFFIKDLESRNHTFVNRAELPSNKPSPLAHNDQITICDHEMVFLERLPKAQDSGHAGIMLTDDAGDHSLHTLDALASSASLFVRPETKLRAILEISRDLSSDLNIDSVAPKILDSLFNVFPQAERGFLVLKDEATGKLARKAFKYRQANRPRFLGPAYQAEEPPMQLSRTIVDLVLNQKQAKLYQDAGALPSSASIAEMKIQSVMCAPLLSPSGQALGIIQLDTSDRKQFTQEDLDLLVAVAGQAAIAVDNARLHIQKVEARVIGDQLKLAAQVQRAFLPQDVPKHPRYEFYSYSEPTYQVGGDFYDFVSLPEEKLAVILGDVSGKGIAAALIMAKFSGEARFFITREPDPAAASARLNDKFCESGMDDRFITLSIVLIDLETNRLTYAIAGHFPLMVKRADGQLEEVGDEVSGLGIGMIPEVTYKQGTLQLNVGDVVVLYSDGVTDARNGQGELYDTKSTRRLWNRVQELTGGAGAIGRGIIQELREYAADQPQADDITLVCFGRTA